MINKTEKQKFTDHFPHDKSFFELKIVWITIKIILAISFIISLVIVSCSNLQFDLSFNGWNNFISYFKVPLATLALLIPLGAIYATNHRSNQTLEQMRLTTEQNNFANYYKHLEEFEKYCKVHHVQIVNTSYRHLHNLIFLGARSGEYNANHDKVKILENSINLIFDEINNKGWSNDELSGYLINITCKLIQSSQLENVELLIKEYQKYVGETTKKREDKPLERNLIIFQLSLCYIGSVYNTIIDASSFDSNFRVPQKVKRLINRVKDFYTLTTEDAHMMRHGLPGLRFRDEDDYFLTELELESELDLSMTTDEFYQAKKSDLYFIMEEPPKLESALGVEFD